MAQFDITEIDSNLREYLATDLERLTRQDKTLLNLIDVDKDAGGKTYDVPISFGQGSGVSPDFDEANDNANTGPAFERFNVDYLEVHSIRKVPMKSVDRATDKTAVEDILRVAMDDAVQSLSREDEIIAFGTGWGDRGVISSKSGAVITLTKKSDAKHFYKGMKVVGAASVSGHALIEDTGVDVVHTVAKVDVVAGTVTMTASINTNWANGTVLFRKGDRQDSGTPAKLLPTGLRGWLGVASATFFGVDQTVDTQLAGIRLAAGGDNAVKCLFRAAQAIADISGRKPTHAIVSANTYGSIMNTLHTTNRRTDKTDVSKTKVGLGALEVETPSGTIFVTQAYFCGDDEMFVLTEETWSIGSCGGELVRSGLPGEKMLTDTGADRLLIRQKSHFAIGCSHPAANCIVTGGSWT